MGRIVVSQFASIDGVVEDPVGMEGVGRGAWSGSASSGEEGGRYKVQEILDTEAMLMGRVTYEGYAAVWPGRTDEFADKINAMPKYVVSSTLGEPAWANTSVLRGDAVTEVARLKEQTAGDIMIQGSIQLVDALLAEDLVDEWRLMIFPIVVGRGRRCFGDPGRAVGLTLAECRAVGDGVVILEYARPA